MDGYRVLAVLAGRATQRGGGGAVEGPLLDAGAYLPGGRFMWGLPRPSSSVAWARPRTRHRVHGPPTREICDCGGWRPCLEVSRLRVEWSSYPPPARFDCESLMARLQMQTPSAERPAQAPGWPQMHARIEDGNVLRSAERDTGS